MEIYRTALKGILAEIGKLPKVWVVTYSWTTDCGDDWYDRTYHGLVGVYTTTSEALTVQRKGKNRKVTKMRGPEFKNFLKKVNG